MLNQLFRPLLDFTKRKFVNDGLWLLVSNIILGVCGILINIILTYKYGAIGFGIFSLGLKIYLVISLLAALGCGASLLKHVAEFKEDRDTLNHAISAGLIVGFMSSLLLTLLGFLATPFIVDIFKNQDLFILYFFLPGIPLFTINKIFSGILNGKREIKSLAIIQSTRWILLIISILVISWLCKEEVSYIALSFPITEFLLIPLSLHSTKSSFIFLKKPSKDWFNRHISFGSQSMLSTAIIDVYNYADIFMIGYFLNVKAVGIYTFASDIAKNLFILANIIEVNFNPIISELWSKKKTDELKKQVKKIRNLTYLIYIPIGLLALIVYYLFIQSFMEETLGRSIYPFTILCIGIVMVAGFKPLSSLPELCGFPNDNLKINGMVLTFNLVLNYLLITIWSLEGVALATSISYVISVFLLSFYAKKRLNIHIFN